MSCRHSQSCDLAVKAPETAATTQGLFITFEGDDGAGKSTHLFVVAEALRQRGFDVVCLREPGGTAIGEQLRAVVLDSANGAMADACELLIYEAARAQLVAQVIAPALERGAVVLCDRFADSTVAYQSFGRGCSRAFIDQANAFACQGVRPDRTILLCAGDDAQASLRRAGRHQGPDRMEAAGIDFHQRVFQGFQALAQEDPDRFRVVRSAGNKLATARHVFDALSDYFPWMGDRDLCTNAYFKELLSRRPRHRSSLDLGAKAAPEPSGAAPQSRGKGKTVGKKASGRRRSRSASVSGKAEGC